MLLPEGDLPFRRSYKSFVNHIHDREMGDAFVVSTCNRTEIYTTTHNYMFVAQLFCETVGVQLMDFMQFVTVKRD